MAEKLTIWRQRWIRLITILLAGCILLSFIGYSIAQHILNTAHEAEHHQMETELQEYIDKIQSQIALQIHTMESLAATCGETDLILEPQALKENLQSINASNDFVAMAYISRNGNGYLNIESLPETIFYPLEDCPSHLKAAIGKALKGTPAVSQLFECSMYHDVLYAYCVPVIQKGVVTGTLIGCDTTEFFTNIANRQTVIGCDGYVHLMSQEGDFLVRSENTVIKEDIHSVFEGPYISKNAQIRMKILLAEENAGFLDFTYEGKSYHSYFQPLNINGWYLMYSMPVLGGNTSLQPAFSLALLLLLAFLLLANGMLYVAYVMFRKNQKALTRFAYIDPVTGSPNLMKFDENYKNYFRAHKTVKPYSIVAINIRNFKSINDLFGQQGGDRLLKAIGRVLEHAITADEFFCRASGDLFYIFLQEADQNVLWHRVEQMMETIKRSVIQEVGSYPIHPYAGIAIGKDREAALVTMQSIRQTRCKSFAFYNESLFQKLRQKNSVESTMHVALERKEFKLFLQPKFDLQTDAIVGAEALVRWLLPNGAYRPPAEFIPVFEANGFCVQLDLYMVDLVCSQLRMWLDEGRTPYPIAVNQSKLLFTNRNYPHQLKEILERYQIPASLITLEILEERYEDDLDLLNEQIAVLHEMGFQVAMDDFGAGYSSLNMLYRLRIDELKLDRQFLKEVSSADEERRQIILEQIMIFANKLQIRTVAEGIETVKDRNTMRNLSCQYGQGYFYERPMRVDLFTEKYLRKRSSVGSP